MGEVEKGDTVVTHQSEEEGKAISTLQFPHFINSVASVLVTDVAAPQILWLVLGPLPREECYIAGVCPEKVNKNCEGSGVQVLRGVAEETDHLERRRWKED